MTRTYRLLPLAALMLSGCVSMAPRYETPDAPIAESLPSGGVEEGLALDRASWQQLVTDPVLEGLIETALENNRDYRVALLNIRVARAQYGITASSRWPAIAAQASVTDTGTFDENEGAGGNAATARNVDQAQAQLAVTSYELDLFGRVTNLNEAALQRYFAEEENARAAQLSLIGSVSNAWVTLITNQRLLSLAEETLDAQQQSLDLTKAQFDAGFASDLDYQRAVTSVEQARADRAAYAADLKQSYNALELLVGQALPKDLAPTLPEEGMPVRLDLVAGQSSEILLTRPDVQASERALRAANADIGAARAAFFPQITLTGSAGYASGDLDNLFSGGTGLWSYTPQVSLPIFTGGRNRASLRQAKAQRDIAVAQYEGAIQSAFRETADALAVAATIDDRIEALDKLSEASDQALYLSRERFKSGVDDYLSVLDAQRSAYQAEQALIAAKAQRAQNAVALFLALGGGEQPSS